MTKEWKSIPNSDRSERITQLNICSKTLWSKNSDQSIDREREMSPRGDCDREELFWGASFWWTLRQVRGHPNVSGGGMNSWAHNTQQLLIRLARKCIWYTYNLFYVNFTISKISHVTYLASTIIKQIISINISFFVSSSSCRKSIHLWLVHK